MMAIARVVVIVTTREVGLGSLHHPRRLRYWVAGNERDSSGSTLLLALHTGIYGLGMTGAT